MVRIDSWMLGVGFLVAIVLLSILGLAFFVGNSAVCVPCQGLDAVNPLCIIMFEICKLFHDAIYFILIASAFIFIFLMVLLGIYITFKGEVDLTKIFAILFVFVLFGVFIILILIDLGINLISAIFPSIGAALESIGEFVLESLKVIILIIVSLVSFAFGIKMKKW